MRCLVSMTKDDSYDSCFTISLPRYWKGAADIPELDLAVEQHKDDPNKTINRSSFLNF